MFLPRQNVVEQPRAHLVGNSSETAHPHGVRPPRVKRKEVTKKFQSTHPHGVRLILIVNLFLPLLFQSTHPHGVRLIIMYVIHLLVMFQSTHPHGVRHSPNSFFSSSLKVSIHAPTRGATLFISIGFMSWPSFNPRTHTGYDLHRAVSFASRSLFQSTHPHGVRPSGLTATSSTESFNPRTHTGYDLKLKISSLLAHYIQLNAKFYYPNIK